MRDRLALHAWRLDTDDPAAPALPFAWYNLVRIHRSLRVTPATERAWDLAELLG